MVEQGGCRTEPCHHILITTHGSNYSWHVLPVCLHGFSPSAPASSQSPKICSYWGYTGIGGGEWMEVAILFDNSGSD